MDAGVQGELINPSKEFGRWVLLVFFGLFGSKGIADALMEYQLQTTPTDQVFSLETNMES